MSIYDQYLLDVHGELIVDLFAGGGGASCGIEMATGRQVDVAINHDRHAVAMHERNHPQTRHLKADVFEVDPREATEGRPVGLLWASPDCTFFSKARGGKPIRNPEKRRRSLAWVVTRWAGQVRPRVIILENVEEFTGWGPLVARRDRKTGRVVKQDGDVAAPGEIVPVDDQQLLPCPERQGERFRGWVRSLEAHGYRVEWREIRACDYGAPTIRKRLFLIARCDGEPIIWPEPSHGPGTGRTYRTAAECIDWSEPMCSIFATRDEAREWGRAYKGRGTPRRPLADATMRRIARGVMRYVVQAGEPFVVNLAQHAGANAFGLVAPTLAQTGYGERKGQAPRSLNLQEPLGTIVGGGAKHALVAAYLAKHFTGVDGAPLDVPAPTVTTVDHNSLVATSLTTDPGALEGTHARRIYAFLQTYYGEGIGQSPRDPLRTITTKDRVSLVVVEVAGQPYVITDIAMRMLQPRELYNAQGFPPDYVIDRGATGKRLTKTAQVRMVGNSVPPPVVASLVRTNAPGMVVRDAARSAA